VEEGKVKKPIWKKWWFWGIAFVIIIAFASSGGDTKDQGVGTVSAGDSVATQSPAPVKESVPDLQVIDHSSSKDSIASYIAGTVKNNTNKTYKYVQVEINLYDASGAQVGSTLANANNLEPNGTWKFKAVTMDDFKTYKIKDVSGF